MTSLMQWAARSAPQLRSAPRSRATISFVPTESVDAASSRPSSIGWRPAKAPKPVAPVDSTAARSRSTRASAVASDTPAASYVFAPSATRASLNEQLAVKLGAPDRAAGDEADDRFAHVQGRFAVVQIEELGQRFRLPLRVVGPELELGDRQRLRVVEQFLEPVARRMELHAVAGAGRHERAPAAVFLHTQLELVGPSERRGEVVLVERDPDVVDARNVPLPGLDDDVDGAAL